MLSIALFSNLQNHLPVTSYDDNSETQVRDVADPAHRGANYDKSGKDSRAILGWLRTQLDPFSLVKDGTSLMVSHARRADGINHKSPRVPETDNLPGPSQGNWAVVVYGRTRQADSWWRAVPAGMGSRGWLGDAVQAVVARGRALDAPRFLLSRGPDGRILVGVATLAAQLSNDMNSDDFGRRLYCFVGWVSVASTPQEVSLDEVRQHWQEWAGPVYREWIGLDWDEHASQLRGPHSSHPSMPPWVSAHAGEKQSLKRELSVNDPQLLPLDVTPGSVWMIPGSQADSYWSRGFVTTSFYVFVVGWAEARRAGKEGATHVATDDTELALKRSLLQF